MVTAIQRQNNIGGFNPAISRTQSSSPRVLTGRNFRWDFDGPFSGFGNVQISDQFIGHSELPYYATFNVGDAVMLFTPNGVYQQQRNFDISNNPDVRYPAWECKLKLNPYKWPDCSENDYPWSTAFVGDSYFFSHPTVGLIKFDTYKCEWSCCIMSCPDIPEGGEGQFYDFSCKETGCMITGPIFGITQAGNRLVIQARDTLGWSAIDDGCRLDCDPFCGGGFVSSSVSRYGKPMGVYETADGFAAFTSNSVIRGATIDSIAGFNVATLTNKSYPINPYAITQMDNFQIMFFSQKGLLLLANNQMAPWQPELSGWVLKLLRRTGLRKVQHAMSLVYSEETDELFLSLLPKPDQYMQLNVFTRALVFDFAASKWGSFDQAHYFVGPVNYDHKVTQVNLGFIGWQQSLHWFDYGLKNAIGNGTVVDHLDSFVTIGPFTAAYEQFLAVETEMVKVQLHTEARKANLFSFDVDGLMPEGFDNADNWELGIAKAFNADVYVQASVDAYGLGAVDHLAFDDSSNESFIKNYTCNTVGIYHTISLTAGRVNAHYSVKSVSVQLQVLQAIA